MTRRLLAGLLTLAAAVGSLVPAGPDPAVVVTDRGSVRGTAAESVRTFDGIPYAAAPVDRLRWAPPEPPEPWPGVRPATTPGPRCPPAGTDEDCLRLNVAAPARSAPPRPVLVWLHGGGFVEGAGSDVDARGLAARGDVVVVTVNYRLGIFGFFGHPDLPDSGTYGLLDQQAAMRWVQRNAAAFGGDPGNVTILGQSAGGQSVCAHLAAPSSAGLFHRAIVQSAQCTWEVPAGNFFPGLDVAFSPWVTRTELGTRGAVVGREPPLGCADAADLLECLRRVDVATLAAYATAFSAPAAGTPLLPESPATALAAGRFQRVPILSGVNHDEHTYVAATAFGFGDRPLTESGYLELMGKAVGPARADEVLARYPAERHGSPTAAWAAAMTDRIWSCPAADRNARTARWMPTFGYEFADPAAPPGVPFPATLAPGATHAAETGYLFPPDPRLAADQRSLSDVMVGYWTAFARTGRPEAPGAPAWHPVGPEGRVLALAPGAIRMIDLAADHQCGFWASLRPSPAT